MVRYSRAEDENYVTVMASNANAIQQRKLGTQGLVVSGLGLGTMGMSGMISLTSNRSPTAFYGDFDRAAAEETNLATIGKALEKGVCSHQFICCGLLPRLTFWTLLGFIRYGRRIFDPALIEISHLAKEEARTPQTKN